eukprot:363275-Chlamydomonas_euryale.AAC.1
MDCVAQLSLRAGLRCPLLHPGKATSSPRNSIYTASDRNLPTDYLAIEAYERPEVLIGRRGWRPSCPTRNGYLR